MHASNQKFSWDKYIIISSSSSSTVVIMFAWYSYLF
jgi:hypothetical protein